MLRRWEETGIKVAHQVNKVKLKVKVAHQEKKENIKEKEIHQLIVEVWIVNIRNKKKRKREEDGEESLRRIKKKELPKTQMMKVVFNPNFKIKRILIINILVNQDLEENTNQINIDVVVQKVGLRNINQKL